MAIVTSTPSDTSLDYNGTNTVTGTISWTTPTVPSNTEITSCVLTGKAKAKNLIFFPDATVNGTPIKTSSEGASFSINLGTDNNITSVVVTVTGKNWLNSGTVTFSDLLYTVTYTIYYTVTFKDENGNILDTQRVEQGSSAIVPDVPSKEGYTLNWDTDFSNVTSDLTVTAQYTIKEYTVTFKDHDGTTLKTQTVTHGSGATAPNNPSREGHTFTGWNPPDFSNVKSDLTVTAQYTINTYTVTFKDYNGTILDTQTVNYGSSATPPPNPSRDGYVFDRWDKSYTNINSDTDITAIYKKLYTVRFLDWDGTKILKSESVPEGDSATAPSDPTRTGYTFTGWNPSDFSNITGDLTVTAQYTINTYTVTFKDYDGKTLKTQTVNYGSDATAPSDPSREGYTFNGWDKSFSNITGDLTITAQYTINTYTVIFVDHDGKTLKTQTVNYGSSAIPPSNPSREGYTFTRWDTDFSSVKSNLTITAIYTINTYTVTFVDHDGKTLKTQTVTHGSPATAPSNPSREGYTFTGWNPSDFSNVKSNLTITAQYTINTYTVIFKDYDGTILKEEQIVEYGSNAIPPNNPSREGYTFTGWDKVFSNVTSNLVITATYVENTASINKILIGDTTTDNLYVGDSNVVAVYIGDFLVFGIDISE